MPHSTLDPLEGHRNISGKPARHASVVEFENTKQLLVVVVFFFKMDFD